jgi:hypothetical protein
MSSTKSIVRSVADLKFETTPVKILAWETGGRRERTENQQRAVLHKGEPKTATLLRATNSGEPYIKVTRLTHAYVGPYTSYAHDIALHLSFREFRKRSDGYIQMPLDALGLCMIAWGEHSVKLDPVHDGIIRGNIEEQMEKLRERFRRGPSILWRDGIALASRWRESRRRFLDVATESVWWNTVESALKMHAEKYPDRYVSQAEAQR